VCREKEEEGSQETRTQFRYILNGNGGWDVMKKSSRDTSIYVCEDFNFQISFSPFSLSLSFSSFLYAFNFVNNIAEYRVGKVAWHKSRQQTKMCIELLLLEHVLALKCLQWSDDDDDDGGG
jgi:hypothetical protein